VTRMRESARRVLIVVWASALIALCAFGLYLVRELMRGSPMAVTEKPVPMARPVSRVKTVILYFGASGGRGLAPEQRDIQADRLSSHELVKRVLEELVNGPASVLIPTVPRETTVNSIFLLEGGELAIDFGKEIQTRHPGGSFAELMTVYSIVNTLTHNFDDISSVRFLVEGEEVGTLVGHVDLTEPVLPDPTWMWSSGGGIE